MPLKCRLAAAACIAALAIPVSASAQVTLPSHQEVSNILGAGARAAGMGGAFTAIADDATAATWNPAGLRILAKPEISLVWDRTATQQQLNFGAFLFTPKATAEVEAVSDVTASRNNGLNFASATKPFNVRGRRVVAQVSYRRLLSFPENDNPFLYRATAGEVQLDFGGLLHRSDAGGIDDYSVSVATRLLPGLDAGVSINYMIADVKSISSFVDTVKGFSRDDSELRYSFRGPHADVGLLYRWHQNVSIGAVYHTGVSSSFHYSQREVASDTDHGISDPLERTGASRVRMPTGYALGVAFRPMGQLTLAADYSATAWSKARISHFENASIDTDFTVNTIVYENKGFPYFGGTQRDTSSKRIGAEYILFGPRKILVPIRAGYFSEEQITNTMGSSLARPVYKGFTVGTGISYRGLQLDLAYVKTRGTDEGATGFQNTDSGVFHVVTENVRFKSNRILASMIFRFD